MEWANFEKDVNNARRTIWNFALQVLDKRHIKRGPTHTFTNAAIRRGLVTGIITTNVDGLEAMDDQLLYKSSINDQMFQDAAHTWIQFDDPKVARLHGDICTVACSGCWKRLPLTPEIAEKLQSNSFEACAECAGRERSAVPQCWRPDIIFYNDPKEELESEHKDKEWREQQTRTQTQTTKKITKKADAMAATTNTQHHHDRLQVYARLIGKERNITSPRYIFVIGSSLSNDRLREDINWLARKGSRVFLINPNKPNGTQDIQGVTWFKLEASDFSQRMLEVIAS